jgi:2-polyprenyl-3-methyl-5-hydroxy-6-metoxy-1,4-benzoquinol methylase
MFYKYMADVYHHIFPAKDKIDFLVSQFKPEGYLLDVGCSDGRVAFEMAKKGFSLEAIDLSEDMIRIANDISDMGHWFNVRQIDMLQVAEFFESNTFDGIYCIGNTLVHLSEKDEILKALTGFKELLKKDRKLVVQIINYDYVYRNNIQSLPLIENEILRFERFYTLHDDCVTFKTKLAVKAAASEYEAETTLLALRKDELESLLKQSGFTKLSWYSNYKGQPFNDDGLPLIVVAV